MLFCHIINFKFISIMGVIKQGILGGFSGKVGGVVGSSWKGTAVMKARPQAVANPKTAAQVNQRTKFSGVVAWGSALLTNIVKPLWDRFYSNMSGYNAFVSTNIDKFDNSGVPTYADLVISKGTIGAQPITVVTKEYGTNLVTIEWDSSVVPQNSLPSDLAYACAYNENKNQFASIASIETREDDSVEMSLPQGWEVADTVHFYLSFARPDKSSVSDNSYLRD